MKKISPLTLLFGLTAFLGAFSIFVVEPLVAKILLPQYGGSSSVWTTSSFYFQLVLLMGYALVHLTMRMRQNRQLFVFVPLGLLAVSLVWRAFTYSPVPESTDANLWLVWTLLGALTVPFLALGVTSPLLQKWYSQTDEKRAADPYFLYAASNIGSFGGLLAYPLVIEANVTIEAQKAIWFALFLSFVGLMAVSYLAARRKFVKITQAEVKIEKAEVPKLSWQKQLGWVGIAFIPSSLMLGFTSYVSTDLGSFPFLWLVPLSIYLLAMTVAFSISSRKIGKWLFITTGFISFAALLSSEIFPLWASFGLGLLALIFVSSLANRLLASQRPHTNYLTRFYLLISLGGALGGAFNSIISPLIFNGPIEYPLILAVSLFLLAGAAAMRKYALALGAIGVLLVPLTVLMDNTGSETILQDRTFYGTYKVVQNDVVTALVHGVTLHGLQIKDEPDVPTTYYSTGSGVGLLMAEEPEQTLAIGLGTGTLAAYGRDGMTIDFIEIDGEVAAIAKDPNYFTFISDSEAQVNVSIGDGRLLAEKFPDNSQDLVAVDAFSSDSIPAHLITKEANELYLSKLKEDGTVVYHISNNYFDLLPVVAANAEASGLKAYFHHEVDNDLASTWVAISKDKDKFKDSDVWEEAPTDHTVLWTDDYSSLLRVFTGFTH